MGDRDRSQGVVGTVRRRDRSTIEYIHELIPIGFTDAQIARRVNKEKGLSMSACYEYVNIAYQELRERITPDTRSKAITQAAVQIAMDRALALKNEDRREAGKCTDRFMRLHGISSPEHVAFVSANIDTFIELRSDQRSALVDKMAEQAGLDGQNVAKMFMLPVTDTTEPLLRVIDVDDEASDGTE